MNIRKPTVIAWLVSLAKLESSAHVRTVKNTSTYPFRNSRFQWFHRKRIQAHKLLKSFMVMALWRSEYLFKGRLGKDGELAPKVEEMLDLHNTLLRADFLLLFNGKVW